MHVFVAVLNWGLGHATRSIPVIKQLLQRNIPVTIGSDGAALDLLKQEFPALRFVELPPNRVIYPAHGSLMLNLITQLPHIQKAIRQEHRQVQELIVQLQFTHIISDNRYGCYSDKIPTVIITHQLRLLFSGVWSLGATIINATLKSALEKFTFVWVPDFGPMGITQPFTTNVNIPHRFVGMLSRFTHSTSQPDDSLILGLVSGPENQRTLFEQALLSQLTKLMRPSVIVRGLTHAADVRVQNGVELINHLPATELEELMVNASVIIARSGYSTIMDLFSLGKQQVILVPTPGQTEQEYLGRYVSENKLAVVQTQADMDLEKAFEMLPTRTGFNGGKNESRLKQALDEFLI
ncbi:MAG: hypothetical protein KF856_18670 [Cyclobacteriaceae bacterium]|nr:hypothetical protein [Cyclobacteriaceae bacterium]